MYLTTLDEILTKQYGPMGTKERDEVDIRIAELGNTLESRNRRKERKEKINNLYEN